MTLVTGLTEIASFRRVRKVAKSDCSLRYVSACLPVHLFVCPYATTRPPAGRVFVKLFTGIFIKIFKENLIKVRKNKQALFMTT